MVQYTLQHGLTAWAWNWKTKVKYADYYLGALDRFKVNVLIVWLALIISWLDV